ncbi:MAG: glycosyltransferase family 2 protein [Planctomycetaceae bacterium]|nr:glycosyltransferase family 2 protein [Planctomycetaceae bacterium]
MPSISVIVPVRNEAKSIEHTLRLLLTQNFPREQYEVIVADGVSTDATVTIVRRLQGEFDNLKLVYNPARFSSAGRNTAIRHSTKDVVVVVDGHCHVPDRNYLKNLSTAFDASGADCLGRPQPLDVPEPSPFQQAVSAARSSRLGHNPGSDIYSDQPKFVTPQSTAVAYSRTVLHRIGMFDEAFDACEDVEFNERVHAAGLTCYFAPAAKIVYEPRSNFRALFYQLSRYGLGRARLAFKHPDSLSRPALVPPLWAVWAILGGLLGLVVPEIGLMWAASLCLYAAVLLAAGVLIGRGQPHGVGRRIPMVFVAIHFGFAWGFWKEVAKQMRSVRFGERGCVSPPRFELSKPSGG